jgi:glutamate-1-semialdehyde aminotransferase
LYNLTKSFEFLKRAKKVLPGQTHTFSKGYYSYVEGSYPVFVERGKGSHLFDVDGNEYIDYILALGPIILGYSYDVVNEAVKKEMENGTIFSMPHKLEIEAAELMTQVIPFADGAKFTKTGSDAVTAAVRASRALTEKDNIAYCGGGGVWHDWFVAITSRNKGVPKSLKTQIKVFEYNNSESLKELLDNDKEIGTVVMEPMIFEYPKKNYLNEVKKIVHDHDAILIFDEVVTGFRFSLGGAAEYFGVEPDLATYGKGIANGFPLGSIAGKEEFMNIFEEIFYSTTFGGETMSLAAGMATIKEIQSKDVLKNIYNKGSNFLNNFNKLSESIDVPIKTSGFPSRLFLSCKDKNDNESLLVKSLFCQELAEEGILVNQGSILHSYSHNEQDLSKTLEKCERAMKIVKDGLDTNTVETKLHGKPMKRVMSFPI